MDRLQILVVEDQAVLALTLADLLGSLGYRAVGPATSLDQALRLLDEGGIDGALLDRDLGGESSQPLAQRLRQLGIPFAWATGKGSGEKDVEPVLNKPFSISELQSTLSLMLRPEPAA